MPAPRSASPRCRAAWRSRSRRWPKSADMSRVRARLEAAGFKLPPPFGPAGTYVSSVETPGHVFVAGVGPTEGRSLVWTGRVGDTLSLDQGKQAARLTALNALAIL